MAENEGGDEEFGHVMPQINIRMPPEEEKVNDPTIDSISVSTKKKKKIIRKKKKKPTEHAKTDPDFDPNELSKNNNDKSRDDKKTNNETASKSSSKSAEAVEDGDENITHRMPTQIDVFEYNRGYWTILFFSNTFAN